MLAFRFLCENIFVFVSSSPAELWSAEHKLCVACLVTKQTGTINQPGSIIGNTTFLKEKLNLLTITIDGHVC
jgi:hypothetical protein